ncbi:hypothetical protein D1610_11725 [Sphingomonas gilva]|uniref:Uncharacterized protein n=1 Tax=Sphingomonas gilva TaxID=2305907 RepID=A0A396RU49_9SPHN|nr:hypothetical protein D1610_11725 [Sphingomonas gilva]
MRPKARRTTGYRTVQMHDLAAAGRLFREAGFVASEDDPISAVAGFNPAGRPVRVEAMWDGGWRATLWLRKDGGHTLRMAIRLVSEPRR